MKKILFISAAVALLATSCDLFKSRDFDDSNNPQSSVSTDSAAAVTTAPNSTATQADSTVAAVPEHKEEAAKGSKK